MAVTPSRMVPLGTKAPDFCLPGADGKTYCLKDFEESPALLVVFLSNHCPFVKHIKPFFAKFVKQYQDKGVAVVGINSNDAVSYPDDSPDKMREDIKNFGYTFPYLIDETQEIAKAYKAACTPDFFLFDKKRKLVYRGQLDDSRPGNDKPITGKDLSKAVDALLEGKPVHTEQKPSAGCDIKWKSGNSPN